MRVYRPKDLGYPALESQRSRGCPRTFSSPEAQLAQASESKSILDSPCLKSGYLGLANLFSVARTDGTAVTMH